MLSSRKEDILRIIVGDYVATAAPVGSGRIVQRYGLKVSPATIRNDMAGLEGEGYIAQPHTSAGRVPLDKGYRYYVEILIEDAEVPEDEQRLVRHQFHQVEGDLEEWTRLAASVLARVSQNVAIATVPKSADSRFERMELILLQEYLALMVLVLRKARLRRHMVAFEGAVSQEDLSAAASKLSANFAGLTPNEISSREIPLPARLSLIGERVMPVVLDLMRTDAQEQCEEPYLTGLRHILRQPEFASGNRASELTELFEETGLLRSILSRVASGEGIRVVIGGENLEEPMRHCSMVAARYGVPGELSGVISVVGPTRMQYARTISIVRFLASVMSELVTEVYG